MVWEGALPSPDICRAVATERKEVMRYEQRELCETFFRSGDCSFNFVNRISLLEDSRFRPAVSKGAVDYYFYESFGGRCSGN